MNGMANRSTGLSSEEGEKEMKQEFEPNCWIDRLATSLSALAPRVRPRVPYDEVDVFGRVQEYTGVVSYEEYRTLASRTQHDPGAEVAFEESHIWFDDDPTDVKAILREHPLIRQVLDHSGQGQAIDFLSPYGGLSVDLKTLALSLTKLAIKTDERNAAQTLHQFLTLGEARELKAYEVTLFYGLKLDRRIDIGEGAFLAPYEDAKAICGEFPFLNRRHLPDGFEQRHPLNEAPKSIAALVRELTWGPAISSKEEELEKTLTTRFRFSIEEETIENPSSSFQFPRDHETVRDFLCIATGEHQIARRQYVRVEKWMEDLDPNIRFGWTSGGGWVNDWWGESHFSEDSAEAFLEMVRAWRTYQGDRDRLGLAIRRLGGLPSRIGRFGTEDRILDTAIALETMYSLDDPEITYKLKTRAGYLLGSDGEKRMEIFRKVKGFYDARSALVHGSRGRRRRIDLGKVLSDGRQLARETLLALLRDGSAPDWDRLVMSAGEGGQSRSTQSAEPKGGGIT